MLESSWRKMLNLVKSLKDLVVNGKQRWLLLFISLWLLNSTFVQIDWPLTSFHLFIFCKLISAIILKNLSFKNPLFTPFKFFARTNICWVLFVIVAGKRSPSGVILYITFLYLFKMLIPVLPFIFIWIGFNPPTLSKLAVLLF